MAQYDFDVTLESAVALLERHRGLFRKAYLFGSVARDDADEHSDADVILVRNSDKDFFHRVTEVMDLVEAFGSIDLLIYTPDEFVRMQAEGGFVTSVTREAVVVEGQQEGG